MRSRCLTRQTLFQYGLAAAVAGPWALRQAHGAGAGPEEDRIIQAAKKLKPAELNGMIWSLYYGGPMNKQQQEFKKLTGIGVREIQDIPTPQIPQRTNGGGHRPRRHV